jgi:metal-responsive CopG/Arc/MetJ family transcriptional regulator
MEDTMARVNVFMSDDLLKAVDSQAEMENINRSALLQKAAEVYLQQVRREQEEAERRRRMQEACRKMDELAKKAGDWDPVAIIRRFRDRGWRDEE